MQDKLITVEVAYALPDRQAIIVVKAAQGVTVYDAVRQSGIVQRFPQIDLDSDKMGVFGKAVRDPKTEVLKAGDRVEIYRPLLIDPKASRVKRAEKAKREKAAPVTKASAVAKQSLGGEGPLTGEKPSADKELSGN